MFKGIRDVESVAELEKFRYIVKKCTKEVCGMRHVGKQRRKGSEWWSEEVGVAVAEKRRGFEEWLKRRDGDTHAGYRHRELW